jgi:hypothetical protein
VPKPAPSPAIAGPEIQRLATPVKRKRKFIYCIFKTIIQLMGAKIDFFFEGEKYFRGKIEGTTIFNFSDE